MPDDDEYAAEITGEVGNDDIRPRKHIAAEDEIAHKGGNAALRNIEKEIDEPHFEAEFAAHVHGTRVAAADLVRILVLGAGDDHGKIDAPHKIAHERHQHKPIPILRKGQLLHTSSSVVLLVAHLDADRRTRKIVRLTDDVFEIPRIGKVQERLVIDHEHEERRRDGDLRRIVKL